MNVPVKHVNEYQPFEKAVIRELWPRIKNTPKDGQQRRFTGIYTFRSKVYDIVCDYILTDEFLRVYKLEVSWNGNLMFTSEPKELPPITKEIIL